MIDYKTATKAELLAEFERLKKLSNDDGFFTKKEFLHFPQIAMPGEAPIAVSSGKMDGKTWLIILTNHRVIFLDKGIFFGLKQVALDLSHISSVGGETKFLSGEITIAADGHTYTVENVSKKGVVPFTNMVKQAIEELKQSKEQSTNTQQNAASNDPFEQLERLASLKEKGIITEEEFQAQKAKILG
ncbi:hypothetical protein A9G10_06455 [Gilliamella sp. wkB308]|nr:hypothetical protein A9G10_06455 [Gilliamella apicola]